MTQRGIYSSSELPFMRAWQRHKDAALLPFTRLLNLLGISPHTISLAGVTIAALSWWLSVHTAQPNYFIFGLIIHVILDGVDGALARNHKLATPSGALVDSAADFLVSAMALGLAGAFTTVPTELLISTGVIYGLLLTTSYLRNERGIPYYVLPRGRLVFYLLLTTQLTAGIQLLAPALYGWLVFSLIMLIIGVFALVRHRSYKSVP